MVRSNFAARDPKSTWASSPPGGKRPLAGYEVGSHDVRPRIAEQVPEPWGARLEIMLRELGGMIWIQVASAIVLLRLIVAAVPSVAVKQRPRAALDYSPWHAVTVKRVLSRFRDAC